MVKEKFIDVLQNALHKAGIHEGDWEEGYTDTEAEFAIGIINRFLHTHNFRGDAVMVWDYYNGETSPSFFGGDSNLYYRVLSLAGTLWYPVTIPLLEEGGIEQFLNDLSEIEQGQSTIKPERLNPNYICSWCHNVALAVEGEIQHLVRRADLWSRLQEIAALKDGWLDGQGKAPDAKGLEWFAEKIRGYSPEGLRLPYVYPTVNGGIRLEWTIGTREISFDVDLANRIGNWHVLDTATDEEESLLVNLETDDWGFEMLEKREDDAE